MTTIGILLQLDRALKRQGPFLFALLLTMFAALPLGAPAYAAIAPVLPLLALYALLVERFDFVPRTTAFACGLFQDLMFGFPLGLSALVFLAVREGVALQKQPNFNMSLWLQWFGFAVAAVVAGVIGWAFMSAWRGALLDPLPPLIQALAGIALYPWAGRLVRALAPAPPVLA